MLAWGVAGLGMGLSYAPLSLVVLAEAPEGAEGTASAALQLCDTLGVRLGETDPSGLFTVLEFECLGVALPA